MSPSGSTVAGEWVAPRHGPPVWSAPDRGWLLTRYADVAGVLRSPTIQVEEVHPHVARVGQKAGRDFDSLAHMTAGVLGYRNPPFHSEGRRFLKKCLGLAHDPLGPEAIRNSAQEAVDDALAAGHADAVRDLGARVPLGAMSRGLGFSRAAGELILRSAHVGVSWRRGMPLRLLDQLQQDAHAVEEVILAEMAEARRQGSGDLAAILELNRAEYGFSDHEVAGMLFFLLLAGVETTAALVASAIYLLVSHPDQLEKAVADPALFDGAVTETLRYIPPLWRPNYRVASTPVEFGGRMFEPGEVIVAHIEQAHFDPDAYASPQTFDITRKGPPILSFAAGVHACLGAAVARLEARIILQTLFASARVKLADTQHEWQEHPVFRRLQRLELIVDRLK